MCAAGALANLCDWLVEGSEENRELLSRVLAGALAGGAIVHSLGAGVSQSAAPVR